MNIDMTIANRIICGAGGAGRSRTYYCTRRYFADCLQPHINGFPGIFVKAHNRKEHFNLYHPFGGTSESQTRDLYTASVMLSQLSYGPIKIALRSANHTFFDYWNICFSN